MENTENTEQGQEQQTPQVPEIELRAKEMGWRPKEEFQGKEEDFIDAKEFVRRKPLFDKIENQSKEIKAVKHALESFRLHYSNVEQVAVEKAINQMKVARKEALANSDADQFELYDDEIKKAEKQLQQIEQTKKIPLVEEQVVHPEWQAFESRNPWYKTTGYMRKFADEVGQELASKGVAPTEVLKQVEQAVRKEFPNKFTNPNKEAAPVVDNSRGASSSSKADDLSWMSEQDKKVYNDLVVKTKMISKEKFIADLKAIQGRK